MPKFCLSQDDSFDVRASPALRASKAPIPNNLVTKNAELEAKIQELTLKIKEMELLQRYPGSTDQESILTSIIGSWQMVDSSGMQEYLQMFKNFGHLTPASIWLALFEAGILHFDFNPEQEILTMYETIGTQEFQRSQSKLGEKLTVEQQTFGTFVRNNALVSVFFKGDEECGRMKRFVRDGRLHVIIKRFGLTCTRIYEKIEEDGSVQNKIAELETKILDLKTQLKTKDEIINVITNENDAFVQMNEELITCLNERSIKVNELEEQFILKESTVEYSLLKEQLKESKRKEQSLVDALNSQTRKTQRQEAEKRELLKRIGENEKELNDLVVKNEELYKELQDGKKQKVIPVKETEKEQGEKKQEEKPEEEFVVVEESVEAAETTPTIETQILGTWKLLSTNPLYGININLAFRRENDSFVELRSNSDEILYSWKLNDKHHKIADNLVAHTYIENNSLVSDVQMKSGASWSKIVRSVEDGKLKMSIKIAERVTEYLFEKQ